MPRFVPDMNHETQRMKAAVRVRIGYEARWNRGRGVGVAGGRAPLGGPFGDMLKAEIEGRFAAGPTPGSTKEGHSEVDIKGQYPVRWGQLTSLVDPSYHPVHRVQDQMPKLYGKPLVVEGEPAASIAWRWQRNSCALDLVLQQKEQLEFGLGGIAVRPVMNAWAPGHYYPASLTVVYPEQAIAIEDPGRPGRPSVFIERMARRTSYSPWWSTTGTMDGPVMVWDVSDPANPYWGEWRSLSEWLADWPPRWIMEGVSYPWTKRGEPLMPVVCTQWRSTTRELLPADESELQAVLDLILQRTWCHVVAHAGSFQRAGLISEKELGGLRQSMLDPTVIQNFFGPNGATPFIIPDSTAAAERLWNMHVDRLREWASRFDIGIEVRESGSAKSGTAILLELTGKYLLRQWLETKARPIDTLILDSLIATHNYLIRSGQLSIQQVGDDFVWTPHRQAVPTIDMLIPESSFTLRYPHFWSPVERKEILAELTAAVDMGRESPRALYLLEHDMEDDRPDGPNWQAADVAIRDSLTDAMSYAAQGYGLRWETRHLRAVQTPDAEESLYDVPKDVADEASRGMDLRRETGVGPNGMKANGKFLVQRCRSLINQKPMHIGAVRELNTWLTRNAQYAGQEDTAEGVTFVMQGGKPAIEWASGILAGATKVEPVEEEIAA